MTREKIVKFRATEIEALALKRAAEQKSVSVAEILRDFIKPLVEELTTQEKIEI